MNQLLTLAKQVQSLLRGRKTYIIGTLMFLVSVEKYLTGDITISQFLTTVQGLTGFNGLLALALRAGIAKQ